MSTLINNRHCYYTSYYSFYILININYRYNILYRYVSLQIMYQTQCIGTFNYFFYLMHNQ